MDDTPSDFSFNTAPSEPEPQRSNAGWVSFLLETIQTIVLAIALYFLIDSVVARVRVENISMEPTLMPGQFLLVNKLSYRMGDFQYGDIIVFHYPPDPTEDYIKRVIGVPGDEVRIANQQVSVNGYTLDEPYISQDPQYEGTWKVPPDYLFVLGDNRNQSSDSHSWGFVPVDYVVGKALVVYWPFSDMKLLTRPTVVNAANAP
ncbi:MAG TPA: signal peptidase I [Anaerolineaceae bacterium]